MIAAIVITFMLFVAAVVIATVVDHYEYPYEDEDDWWMP